MAIEGRPIVSERKAEEPIAEVADTMSRGIRKRGCRLAVDQLKNIPHDVRARPCPITVRELLLGVSLLGAALSFGFGPQSIDLPNQGGNESFVLINLWLALLLTHAMVLWVTTQGDHQRVMIGSLLGTVTWTVTMAISPQPGSSLSGEFFLVCGWLLTTFALAWRCRIELMRAAISVGTALVIFLVAYNIWYSMVYRSYSGKRPRVPGDKARSH